MDSWLGSPSSWPPCTTVIRHTSCFGHVHLRKEPNCLTQINAQASGASPRISGIGIGIGIRGWWMSKSVLDTRKTYPAYRTVCRDTELFYGVCTLYSVLFIPLGLHGDAWCVVRGAWCVDSLSHFVCLQEGWRPCYPVHLDSQGGLRGHWMEDFLVLLCKVLCTNRNQPVPPRKIETHN